MGKTITLEELKINEPVGWYTNKGGVVYQVVTISPRKVRYIGKLEAPDPDSEGAKSSESKTLRTLAQAAPKEHPNV